MNPNDQDPLAQWCKGEYVLEVDGKKLTVRPTMQHYRKLRNIQRKAAVDKQMSESNTEEQLEIFKEILQHSYPNSGLVEQFLMQNEIEFMKELFIAFKWGTRKDYEKIMANEPDKLKKNQGEQK